MFKDDEIKKLALATVRRDKKNFKYVSIIIVLFCIIASATIMTISTYQKILSDQEFKQYGRWLQCDQNSSLENIKKYQTLPLLDGIGQINYVGSLFYNNKPVGILGTFNDTLKNEEHFTFVEGRFPQAKNEIAIQESYAEILTTHKTIGDTISLTYQSQDTLQTANFTVVGIIKDCTRQWASKNIIMPTFIGYDLPIEYQTTFLYSNTPKQFLELNKEVVKDLYTNHSYNLYIALDDNKQLLLAEDSYNVENTTIISTLLTILGFIAVASTLVSSNKKRLDYIIALRRLGATTLQMMKLLFYENILVFIKYTCLGISLGICLGAIICYVLCLLYQSSYFLAFNMVFIAELLFSLFAALCFGLLHVWRYLADISIHGSIRIKGKQKLNKYHKSSYITPHFLANKLISSNRFVFVLMAIVCLLLQYNILAISDSYQHYKNKMNDIHILDNFNCYIYSKNTLDFSTFNIDHLTVDTEPSVFVQYNDEYINMYTINQSYTNYQYLKEQLTEGKMPQKENEILIDSYYQKNTIDTKPFTIGQHISIKVMYNNDNITKTYTIVGIINQYISPPFQTINFLADNSFKLSYDTEYFNAFIIGDTLQNEYSYKYIYNMQAVDVALLYAKLDHIMYQRILNNQENIINPYDIYDSKTIITDKEELVTSTLIRDIIFQIVIIISLLIVFRFLVKIMVEANLEDVSLLTIIGMTTQQVIKMYMIYGIYLLLSMAIIPFILLFNIDSILSNYSDALFSYILLLITITLLSSSIYYLGIMQLINRKYFIKSKKDIL